jgi:TDG/mug DNA glycosylase family protein
MLETHPFGNFVPENIKYLLLGSFTSKNATIGTNYDWFYSNGRNQFWPIIRKVYNLPLETKEEKQALFENLGIGIADIIYQCERSKGTSLDSNLTNIVYNPKLENILKNNQIKTIFFSSRYVENLYRRIFKNLVQEFPNIELITLPSPSPRFAKISKEEKIRKYKILLPL